MKTTIRHSLIALALAAMMPLSALAQDARQRTTATVIADVLNSMPAETEARYNAAMHDLAATGADGVQQLAAMHARACQIGQELLYRICSVRTRHLRYGTRTRSRAR